MTIERQFSVEYSIETAISILNGLDINFSLTEKGNIFITHSCILSDRYGRYLTQGHGKGYHKQSKASAIFEAIEHYYSIYFSKFDVANKLVSLMELSLMPAILPEKCVNLLLKQTNQTPLSKLYRSLKDDKVHYLPLFLSLPSYSGSPMENDNTNYTYIDLYATNSGTAAGLSVQEALIHGINEVIERDAFSGFLINTYIKKDSPKIKLIRIDSLPEQLLELVKNAKIETGSELVIMDVTGKTGIPAYFVSVLNMSATIQPSGCGCSLSCDYALERAVLEAVQSFHLYNAAIEEEDLRFMEKFNNYPRYQACVQCNIIDLIQNEKFEYCDWSENAISFPMPLEEYLTRLNERLQYNGYEIYYTTVGPQSEQFSCVHVVIPGMERFNLVRNGLPLIPMNRV